MCVFCQIATGEQPGFMVFEDELALAFLDTTPLFVGHTLLVPRVHYETLTDVPPDLLAPLFARAQKLAGLMESTLGAAGTFVAMNNRISQSVPHLHIHVVPRNKRDGLRGFFWPRTKYDSDAHASTVAGELAAAYQQLS